MLRAYRSDATLPRVLGNVYLFPFRGWPVLSGPALKGARVTMFSGAATLRATTDGQGRFSLDDAPAGIYSAWADLPPFHMGLQSILHVPEVGCGYTDIQLTTATALQGIVLDHRGKPAAKVPVEVQLRGYLKDTKNPYAIGARTDGNGQFVITGVPDADVYLSAGSDRPTTAMPYRRIYYPRASSRNEASVLRFRPGDHRQGMVLWLEPPLERSTVKIRVVDKHGDPAMHAGVFAFDDDGVIAEYARTDMHGIAELSCLRGLEYDLKALTGLSASRTSSKPQFTCGPVTTALRLILGHPSQ